MDLARMQADTANRMEGDLKGYDCPKCRNRGFSLAVREDATLVARVCSCMGIRKSLRAMEASGLMHSLKRCTLDSFRADSPWQQKLKETAAAYAANPEGWLYFSGQSGCGKTHLCTAVCGALLDRGMDVRYLAWREQCAKLKFRDEDSALQDLQTVQVLYVDDLFKSGGESSQRGAPTQADLSLAFTILNARYQAGLPTLISSEYTADQLLSMDEALGGRILEMAGEKCITIRRERSRNYRLKLAGSL